MQKQLKNCIVKAPQDGILVYSKDRYWDPSSKIQAGAMIQYQQTLFTLPDLTRMQVSAKIHEAMVKKLKPGQLVDIKVDADANHTFEGVVEKIATLADSRGYWDERAVKQYVTIVKMTNLPAGVELKPGMTAEVTIKVKTIPNCLMVPVQAVSQHKAKHFAYVLKSDNTLEKREVTVGETNDKYVVVETGLEQDERVVLDARARLADETKKEEAAGEPSEPAAKDKAPVQSPVPGSMPAK
jgi:HlyD family secretion protein